MAIAPVSVHLPSIISSYWLRIGNVFYFEEEIQAKAVTSCREGSQESCPEFFKFWSRIPEYCISTSLVSPLYAVCNVVIQRNFTHDVNYAGNLQDKTLQSPPRRKVRHNDMEAIRIDEQVKYYLAALSDSYSQLWY